MRVVASVPAKRHSSRIENKNLSIIDGDYLYRRCIKKLLQSSIITSVYLDTDDESMIHNVRDLPVSVLRRDPALCNNMVDGHTLFANEVKHIGHADIYVQILCTSPFLSIATIDRALEQFIKSPHTSLVAVHKDKQYLWHNNIPDYGYNSIPNSFELADTYKEAMSFYAVKNYVDRDDITMRFDTNVMLYEISLLEFIDINTPEDLYLSRVISSGLRSQNMSRLNFLKRYLSSAILYDACSKSDINMKCLLPSYLKPISGGKIFGYAKTLSVSYVDPAIDNDWKGIYNALGSYDFIQNGDVIVVQNKVNDRAYFGDLNCDLSIRAGACGVVIDGYVRDVDSLRQSGLSVFCKGSYAMDVKYFAKLESLNSTIDINGVLVSNNDIIFADNDGVIVISSHIFDDVLNTAIDIMLNEFNIKRSIILGDDAKYILKNFGEF